MRNHFHIGTYPMMPHAEGFPLFVLCCLLAHVIAMPPQREGMGGRVDKEVKELCQESWYFNIIPSASSLVVSKFKL